MIKTSIVVSTQPAAFSAVAYKGQLEKCLNTIKRLGYDGIELAVRDPLLLNLEELNDLIAQYELDVPAIGTGQAFSEEGLSLTHPEERIRIKAIERLKTHIDLAIHFNAVVIIGSIRGQFVDPDEKINAQEWLVDGIKTCAEYAPEIRLAIEPLNRYETEFVNTIESAIKLAEKIGAENIGLLLDTFHMNIEEASITNSFILAGEKLFHVHVADSNRRYPGAGHIDFPSIVKILTDTNYEGYLSAEIMPCPDARTATEKTMQTFHSLLSSEAGV
jgi:sugar phosphate isomerase/epimerase